MRILIIGGGVAALEAAAAARKQRPDAEITICSRELVPPYRRPALTRMVAETLPDAQFYLKPTAFYAENRIVLELGRTAEALDASARRVRFSDGSETAWDRLLIASGADAFRPPLPGVERPGVMALRDFAALEKLNAFIETNAVRRAVVLGCGLLGLELAESLLKRGLRVTMLETAAGLLPRQLDAESAAYALEFLRAVPGLELLFGANVTEFTGADGRNGAVSGVALSDGRTRSAELAMLSVGNRPAIGWTDGAVETGRAIRVDRGMRTSQPGIYAAGDCAEFDRQCCGLFSTAKAMGEIAGLNLGGGNGEIAPCTPYPARLAAFDLKLVSLGDTTAPERVGGRLESGAWRKLFLRDGRIVGGVLMRDWSKAMTLQNAVAHALTPAEAGL